MMYTQINEEAIELLKEIRSIKKPKEINPLLSKVESILKRQLESLDIQIN